MFELLYMNSITILIYHIMYMLNIMYFIKTILIDVSLIFIK